MIDHLVERPALVLRIVLLHRFHRQVLPNDGGVVLSGQFCFHVCQKPEPVLFYRGELTVQLPPLFLEIGNQPECLEERAYAISQRTRFHLRRDQVVRLEFQAGNDLRFHRVQQVVGLVDARFVCVDARSQFRDTFEKCTA